MKNPWIAAVLNFFLMGAGTLYNGRRPVVGIGLTLGARALTYVELSLQKPQPTLWAIMFAAVFVVNACLAYDGYKEAQVINGKQAVA